MTRARITIVDSFDPATLRRICHPDPARITFYTDSTQQVLSATGRGEQWISAERWHLSIEELTTLINTYGEDLSYSSPAAFALSLWRKRFGGLEIRVLPGFAADLQREAVYGGRCEVYTYLEDQIAHKYDINGAYSAAAGRLSFPHPYHLQYTRPPSLANITRLEGVSTITFSQAGDRPYLPVHTGGRLLFPVTERCTATYTHTEIRAALEVDAIRLLGIVAQYTAPACLPGNPFAPFVEYCYSERQAAESPALRRAWKVIPNSLFGRLAVGPSRAGMGKLWTFRPTNKLPPDWSTRDNYALLGYGAVGRPSTAPSRGIVLWAGMILAEARRALYTLMDSNTVYVDTDCIVSTVARPDLEPFVGAGLGDLKYDHGPYHQRGTQAYIFMGDLKLRGISRATRSMQDYLRTETTSERQRQPDNHTTPLEV